MQMAEVDIDVRVDHWLNARLGAVKDLRIRTSDTPVRSSTIRRATGESMVIIRFWVNASQKYPGWCIVRIPHSRACETCWHVNVAVNNTKHDYIAL